MQCQGTLLMSWGPCRCLEALRLQDMLQAIRRYFFMGAGDWADALVAAHSAAGPSLEPHSLHACHSMLDMALQVQRSAGTAAIPAISCASQSRALDVREWLAWVQGGLQRRLETHHLPC